MIHSKNICPQSQTVASYTKFNTMTHTSRLIMDELIAVDACAYNDDSALTPR